MVASKRYILVIIRVVHEVHQHTHKSGATCTESDAILAKNGQNRQKSEEMSSKTNEKLCKCFFSKWYYSPTSHFSITAPAQKIKKCSVSENPDYGRFLHTSTLKDPKVTPGWFAGTVGFRMRGGKPTRKPPDRYEKPQWVHYFSPDCVVSCKDMYRDQAVLYCTVSGVREVVDPSKISYLHF